MAKNFVEDAKKSLETFVSDEIIRFGLFSKQFGEEVMKHVVAKASDEINYIGEKQKIAAEGYKLMFEIYSMILDNAKTVPVSLLNSSYQNNPIQNIHKAVNLLCSGADNIDTFIYSAFSNGFDQFKNDVLDGRRSFPAYEYGLIDCSVDETELVNMKEKAESLMSRKLKLESSSFFGFFTPSKIEKIKYEIGNLYATRVKLLINPTELGNQVKSLIERSAYSWEEYTLSLNLIKHQIRSFAINGLNYSFESVVSKILIYSDKNNRLTL